MIAIFSLIGFSITYYISTTYFISNAEEIIPSIEIINIQSYPRKGGYWTVSFTVEGNADLKIQGVEGTTWSNQTCPTCDLLFTSLKNETTSFPTIWKNNSIIVKNFSSSSIVKEVSKVCTLGDHILQFTFGNDTVYAYNNANTWWNHEWGYRKKICINHSQIVGNLHDFPVLVSFSDDDLKEKARPSGNDIAFVSFFDNTTQYYHEIENYSEGTLVAWVQMPHITSNENISFWMYYGNSNSPSQQEPNNVWNSNFKMVHHFNESSNPHYDSTIYSNDGNESGGVNQSVSGKIDGADDFDGVDDFVLINSSESMNITEEITIESWIWIDDIQDGVIIAKEQAYRLWIDDFGDPILNNFVFEIWNGTDWEQVITPLQWEIDSFYYIVGTFNGTNLKEYRNAMEINQTSYGGNISTSSKNVLIGTNELEQSNFSGIIDEIRISNISLNESWIRTSYNTVFNQSKFLSIDVEESASPVISNPSPSNADTKVPNRPSYFEITVSDPNPELLTIVWRTNQSGNWVTFNVTNGTGSGVSDGTYLATNTSWVTLFDQPYWWSVNVTDGLHWTNETFWFTMHQFEPVINSFDLRDDAGSKLNNATGNLIVDNEYFFSVNITDKNGWNDIDYINITSWYDHGDDTSTYNQSTGGNYNLYLQYKNVTGISQFHMIWPDDESLLQPTNCTEISINKTTRIITISFIPGNQTHFATSNGSWTSTENSFDDLYSWNLNCSIADSFSNTDYYADEYGVDYYSAIRSANLVEITGAPGMIVESNVLTIDFISNADYTLKIYFDENLTQLDGSDTIGIDGNLSLLEKADANDDILVNITFSGVGQQHAITLLDGRNAPSDGTGSSIDVQFELGIPFGTWGTYSSSIIKKITRS